MLAAQRIARHPEHGVVRRDLAPPTIRFVPLPRYRYVLVYETRAAGVPVILRVLHGAMDLPDALTALRSTTRQA